uniref:Uncharacterized protein n=1 Tax=Nonomuraea gerenzanensis TaxID=93944 RepID=A0A1M4EGS7_9ACTN|nr:hypothetical protein BN4615_P7615 [Nonomuraea gerenzanensis]
MVKGQASSRPITHPAGTPATVPQAAARAARQAVSSRGEPSRRRTRGRSDRAVATRAPARPTSARIAARYRQPPVSRNPCSRYTSTRSPSSPASRSRSAAEARCSAGSTISATTSSRSPNPCTNSMGTNTRSRPPGAGSTEIAWMLLVLESSGSERWYWYRTV